LKKSGKEREPDKAAVDKAVVVTEVKARVAVAVESNL
jgi:hypothetical protein